MKKIFGNQYNKRKFTQELSELICSRKFDLQNALDMMSRNTSENAKISSI